MALPRNSRRTASIPTTDHPPAPATARWDEAKIVLPPRTVIPQPACWLRGLCVGGMGGPTAERVYTRRLCAVALSVGARAICFKPDALRDDGRQVPNADLPSSDGELAHDLHRRKLARGGGSLAAGDGRKRNGGIAHRAVGAARRRELLRQRPTHPVDA